MTANGESVASITAVSGARIFLDDSMELSNISKELGGSNLFQLGWDDVNSTSISVSCDKGCTVVVAIWDHKDREDRLLNSLRTDRWVLRNEQLIGWKKYRKYGRRQKEVNGVAKAILSKNIQANRTILFTKPENDSPMAIFVIQGTVKIRSIIEDIG